MTEAEGEALYPLRIRGGFLGAVGAALGGWWREIYLFTALNLLWTAALFSLVALPPATAAVFYVARQVLAKDYVDWRTFVEAIRRYFVPAWRWGLLFLVIGGVLAVNLWVYQDSAGRLLMWLRWTWAALLVFWAALNLFFWPFWFAQEASHRTVRVTLRNCLTFLRVNPLPSLLSTIVLLLLGTLSVLTGVFLGTVFMVWTALLATAVLAAYLPATDIT